MVRAVSAEAQPMTLAALNRALLARQGLLERLDAPLVEAVEAVGALQAQYWPAPPVALWSRVADFALDPFYAALERGDLVTGTLLRVTLHLVSAREHPAYAAVAAEAAGHHWRRTDAEPGKEVAALLTKLRTYAAKTPRTGEEIAAFLEEWVAAHPKALDPAEVEHQRKYTGGHGASSRPFARSRSWSASSGSSDCGASSIAAHGSPSRSRRLGTLATVSSSGSTSPSSSQAIGVETCAPARARTDQAPKTVLCGAFWL
jgi:hypothetical protein